MNTAGRPKRRKSLSDALEGLSDGDFWNTRSAEPDRPSVAEIVTQPVRLDDGVGGGRGSAQQSLRTAQNANSAGQRAERQATATGSAPLLFLRPRNARREVATGRIAVRVSVDVVRRFNAIARLRREPRGVLLQRVITGFLDRLDRDGVGLIAELHKELGLGRELVVDEDVWTVPGEMTLTSDESTNAEPMVQMAHAVDLHVAQRFDNCAWRLQTPKDTLGRLVIAAFLWRFVTQRPDLEAALGFSAADIRTSAGMSFR